MKAQSLKNAILQLAVQGKLVPQDKKDEPASILLEKIKAEKLQLIKDKKIKAEKILSEITDDEKPFDIPDSWEWVRLGEVVYNFGQKTPTTQFSYIDVSSIDNEKGKINECAIVEAEKAPSRARKIVQQGTVIYSTVRPYLLNIAIVDTMFEREPIASTAFAIMNPFKGVLNKFLYYYLRSNTFIQYVNSQMIGVAYPAINDEKLFLGLFPLPPLAEQQRIVEKIEQLMPLIEKYDKYEKELSALEEKFPQDLKKSILSYAVQGKLVSQDEADEPASILLEKIKAEKARLIKDKKIKAEKPLPEITDEEKPFDIPRSWEWVRLGNLLQIARGGSPRPIEQFLTEDDNGVNWIKISDSDIGGKYVNSTKQKIKLEGISKSRFVKKGDFLLTNSMSFGRPYILNLDGCIHDGWLVLSNVDIVFNKDFLYHLLCSNFIFNQFCSIVSGGVVKNLNSDKVATTVIPLPPLTEQQRIVEKVESLMSLCDILADESKLMKYKIPANLSRIIDFIPKQATTYQDDYMVARAEDTISDETKRKQQERIAQMRAKK